MKEMEYLLEDEINGIEKTDFEERKKIIHELEELPHCFFGRLRHLQPQIGCLNMCSCCSQSAHGDTEFWTLRRMRNIIAALKYATSQSNQESQISIASLNSMGREGVIFPYLDNDIGYLYNLDQFITMLFRELGVRTRISTVGFSRKNKLLNNMHKRINRKDQLDAIGGVRLSFTPYAIGWSEKDGYDRNEYTRDIANFLKIYRPYYDEFGSGARNMCVELRYRPLVKSGQVVVDVINGHFVVMADQFVFVSRDRNIFLKEAQIADVYDHTIILSEKPTAFYCFENMENKLSEFNVIAIITAIETEKCDEIKICEGYKLENSEGEYYSFDPHITEKGNYGVNVYPKTPLRQGSGILITERFFLNALYEYKTMKGLGPWDTFPSATWDDVEAVIELCKKTALFYEKKKCKIKSIYIEKEIIPMLDSYRKALKMAGYDAKVFFDLGFTIDTGIICNMGKAISEFDIITNKRNEPLTPSHDRNYGKHNSTMTEEGRVWRLSVGYHNTLIVEELDLSLTSSIEGQCVFRKVIQLKGGDLTVRASDLKKKYIIPGQR